jgi:hypothetical protein
MAMLNIKNAEDGLLKSSKKLLPYYIEKLKWSILDWKLIQKKEKEQEKSSNSQNEAGS